MTAVSIKCLLFILLVFSGPALPSFGSEFMSDKSASTDTVAFRSPFYKDNERCFICHGQKRYEYTNTSLGRQVKAMMFSERVVDREKFYQSNHKGFSCTDCHSRDYVQFPHPGELRMELKLNCIDCHGGDEMYSRYNFETIESEYRKSVHFKLEEEGFSCWKCHNPHEYKINIRKSDNLKETILYDNNICLNCHSDYERFKLLSDREEINILTTHDWLPNQGAHFKSVRCIECHAKVNDTLLVAHLIREKADAVKTCNECHTQNSLLMSSLYKFKSREQRKNGFFNGIIMNESYVIGANRSQYLNNLSIIIFIMMSFAIAIHLFFRIRGKILNKKK